MGLGDSFYGDEEAERDWIHVEDMARVIYKVIKEKMEWMGGLQHFQ